MQLKFWGVRGSVPTPCTENMGYGGNTACLEIRLPSGEILIIDGGTGAHPLGESLMKGAAGQGLSLHLLLTHFHWDHIQGIPLFPPLYSVENTVTFYSAKPPHMTRKILEGQMSVPYFPIDFRFLAARRNFVETNDRSFQFGGARIATFPLNHPQGCHGYRIEEGGSTLVFASDLEHGVPEYDRILLEASQDADVLVFDAQFTPEEYERHRGWGHSTWLEATRVARMAGAKRLVLFHHDPSHNDDALRDILHDAQQEFPETTLATEGKILQI